MQLSSGPVELNDLPWPIGDFRSIELPESIITGMKPMRERHGKTISVANWMTRGHTKHHPIPFVGAFLQGRNLHCGWFRMDNPIPHSRYTLHSMVLNMCRCTTFSKNTMVYVGFHIGWTGLYISIYIYIHIGVLLLTNQLPSGTLTWLCKITIFNGKTHYI